MVRKSLMGITVLAMVLSLVACTSSSDEGTSPPWDYLRPSGVPLPDRGFASLGKSIREMSELVTFADRVGEGCEEPLQVHAERISYVLPDGIQHLVAAAAVCRQGYGDVLVILTDGSAREVQQRYWSATEINRTLWTRNDYIPMFGNDFFVVVQSPWRQRDYSLAGLRYLRCGEYAVTPDYNNSSADLDGCDLLDDAGTP